MADNKRPTVANGKICYIEIPAIDINSSAAFYKEAFGWHIRQRTAGHIAFDDTVGEVSGTWVTGRKATTEPGLLIYIMVDDVHVAVDKIVTNGGKIVKVIGFDPPELTALFSDLAGNIFGIYQQPTKEK